MDFQKGSDESFEVDDCDPRCPLRKSIGQMEMFWWQKMLNEHQFSAIRQW